MSATPKSTSSPALPEESVRMAGQDPSAVAAECAQDVLDADGEAALSPSERPPTFQERPVTPELRAALRALQSNDR